MYSKEITIPDDVEAKVDGNKIMVSGSKGDLKREFKLIYGMKIQKENEKITVVSESDRRKAKALVGTVTSHIRNMMKGVKDGYSYQMKIVYSHFPMNVKVEGNKFMINNFLGERTARIAEIFGNTKVKIEGQNVTIDGIDLEAVGTTASNIEQACRITGYDKRRFSDGIFLVKGKK